MLILQDLFSTRVELNILQMSIRALVVFLFCVILIRISGRRSFGFGAPFDMIILMLLGSILSRAISGTAPFFPVLASSFAICALHRLLGMLMLKFPSWEAFFKGKKLLLYQNNKFNHKNMSYSLISDQDIQDELAHCPHIDSLDEVSEIYILGNGKLSFIKKTN